MLALVKASQKRFAQSRVCQNAQYSSLQLCVGVYTRIHPPTPPTTGYGHAFLRSLLTIDVFVVVTTVGLKKTPKTELAQFVFRVI